MSTDRDVTRTVRSWLEEGVTALPDRVLDAVLDQVPATQQRRVWWPARRLQQMSTSIRTVTALAAVVVLAVVVVAVVGFNLIPSSVSVGGPPATQVPTAAPTPSPGPSPTAGALVVSEAPRELKPGTYAVGGPFLVRVTFTVPAGWTGAIKGPYLVFLQRAVGPGVVAFQIFDKVYANPCHYQGLLNPLPGPSVAELATALASLPGLTATTPTDVSLGGYQGKQLTLTAPASFDGCTLAPDGAFRIWELPLGATNDLTPGEIDRVWTLDVAGQRLVIDAEQTPDETTQATAEVQGILDSIHLAPLK